MVKYLLEHDKPNCIGCAGCIAVHPKRWSMEDGLKADIIKGRQREDSWQELEISEEDLKDDKAAAEVCPVNVIHIKNKETGEKVI